MSCHLASGGDRYYACVNTFKEVKSKIELKVINQIISTQY